MRPFCLLITPQSNLRFASSPAGEPLVCLTSFHVKPPSLRFGVERRRWRMKRNGERAGTGRITNGSE